MLFLLRGGGHASVLSDKHPLYPKEHATMSDLVAVSPPLSSSATLKRLALIFDRICIHHLDMIFKPPAHWDKLLLASLEAEIRFLMANGVVFEAPEISPKDLTIDFDTKRLKISYRGTPQIIIRTKYKGRNKEFDFDGFLKAVVKSHDPLQDLMTRLFSCELRNRHGVNACAVVAGNLRSEESSNKLRSDVLTIVLHALPEPDDSVPWEQVLEFRDDPDSRSKFLALNNWMIDIARASYTPLELSQKLEFLIDDYQTHLRLHKMKTKSGSLEALFVASAEFLEDLAKFRWGKIAKRLFTIRHQRIALLEAELTFPGREVAYLAKAREFFSPYP
jgi:hypothetical protein